MSLDKPEDPPDRPEIKNNTSEEGTECYNHWLSSVEEKIGEVKNVQLSLKLYEKETDKLILHDNFDNVDIKVNFTNGIPICSLCNTEDCAHTGFAICVKQNES